MRVSLNMFTYSYQYKKQQRELQFKFRKHNCEDVPVLTIDQCQGKEADIVAISMVKKPTGFLNKNRLNVALSRVRRKLYFVADKNKFQEASLNSNWECFELAKDLLKLAADGDDSGIVAEDGSEVIAIAREDTESLPRNLQECEIIEGYAEYIKSPEKKKEKEKNVVEIAREDVDIVPWKLQENYVIEGYAEAIKSLDKKKANRKKEKKDKNVVEIAREDVDIVPWKLQENDVIEGYAEYMKSPEKDMTNIKDKNYKRKEKQERKKIEKKKAKRKEKKEKKKEDRKEKKETVLDWTDFTL
jgi:hypothetical protein